MRTRAMAAVFLAMFTGVYCSGAAELEWARKGKGGQVMGAQPKPSLRIGAVFVPESGVEGATNEFGRTSMMEMEFISLFLYHRHKSLGEFDLSFSGAADVFFDEAGVDLPGQLARLAMDLGWTKRYGERFQAQIRIMPGIYSDLEEIGSDVLYLPFSVALVRGYAPSLSGTLGLDVRPGFDRPLIPRIGLVWEASDSFRLEAMLPESRAMWVLNNNWRAHLGFAWNNTDYAMDEDAPYNRNAVTVEDFRVSLGFTRFLSDQVQLTGEVGEMFERSVEFHGDDSGSESEFELENELLVGISLSGPF